jgi:hypothetical protein
MATWFWEQRPSGTPVFHSGALFPHFHRQTTLTTDFNGVGNSDLAIMDSYQNAVTILLRNGDGALTQGTTIF